MLETPIANFTGAEDALFSPDEIRFLMRAEFDRARRYAYPLACLLIGVDRLDKLSDLYGREARFEIRDALVEILRGQLRVGDFLGCLLEEQVLIVLPHTGADGARALTRRLMAAARELAFEGGGRTLGITVSVSAAYSDRSAVEDFEGLVRVAEAGLRAAADDGGDRFIEWKETETDVERLRRDLEARMQSLRNELPELVRRAQAAPRLAEPDLVRGQEDVLRRAIDLLARAAGPEPVDDPALAPLAGLVPAVPPAGAGGGAHATTPTPEPTDAADVDELIERHNREVDLLERRIAKLSRSLEVTEEELRQMALLKDVDQGVSSIYREVQGLSADAHDRERREAMMSSIFEANLELQDRIQAAAVGPRP